MKGKWETVKEENKPLDIFLETRRSYKKSEKNSLLRAAYFALFIKSYVRYVKKIRMG